MGLISRKLCRFLLMFLTGFTPLSVFFFLYQSPSSSLSTVFDSVSSKIDEVLSINPSAIIFVLGDFNVHHKDWLTYSGETDDLVNSVIIFLSQMTLPRWWTFLLGYQTLILIVLLFWIYILLLMLVFVLQWLSFHWEILIILLSQFPLTFNQIQNGCSISLHSLWLFSCWLGWSSWSFERCSMGGYL